MKVSDFVIDFLVNKKISHVFEVCGGALVHLLDSLYDRKDIMVVSVHHEQAAAMAAEGYARIKGSVGVAMATSGPGATNMITGIGSCFFDSIPTVFITGQVNTYEFKFNKPVRQIGFQETDIVNIVKPIVKEAVLLSDPLLIRYHLQRAFHIAQSGRPGPVLLDIPMDVQRADVKLSALKSFSPPEMAMGITEEKKEFIKIVADKMSRASRPVILVGGGVVLSKATDELWKLVSRIKIPVVASLMGLDVLEKNHEAFVGMIGTYGNRYANLAVASSDFLLCLGTRLDTRQTGTKPETFAKNAIKVHVDIDAAELNNKIKVDFSIQADIKEFLIVLNQSLTCYDSDKIIFWRKKVENFKHKYPSFIKPAAGAVSPNFLINRLSEYLPKEVIVCADIGQNQIWAAQSLVLKKKDRFLTQGGMGTMGSALPMAIGASFAHPGRPVVVICGDGGFQLNIQELQTIFHYKLPIKIVLLNNSCYGMVRQFQEQYFNSRFQSTIIGYSCPDFQRVVSAYKIPSLKITKNLELDFAFKKFFISNGPAFLEVKIPQRAQVFPKLGVNKPIEDQEPFLPREEFISLMNHE